MIWSISYGLHHMIKSIWYSTNQIRIANVLQLVFLGRFKTFLGFKCAMGVTKSQMVHQNIGQGSLYDLSSWKYLIYSTTRFKNNNSLEKRDFSRRNSNRYLALFQVLNWSWAQVSNELLLFWVIKRDELVRIYFRITWYSIRKSTAKARASQT